MININNMIDNMNECNLANNKELCDRLGLAWVRLNEYEWDDILGDKPTDYKSYCNGYMDKIENLMGDKAPMLTSWYWCKYKLNRTFKEWINWYMWGEYNDYTD